MNLGNTSAIATRRFALFLTGIIGAICQSQALCAELSQPIIDGCSDYTPNAINKADKALVSRLVLKRATEFWELEPDCVVQDVATGSFTIKGVKQRAFLYHVSNSGHNYDNDGIAIIRNGRLDAHYAYQGGAEFGIICLPDLDGDGLNEIALRGGKTIMGETTSTDFVYSLRPRKERRLISITTYDEWESGPTTAAVKTAYQLFAGSGRNPQFYLQKYNFKHNKWVKAGSPSKAKSETYSQPYKLISLKGHSTIEDYACQE